MKEHYDETELEERLARVSPRTGWDFSSMDATLAPTPWDYATVARSKLHPQARVLDVGTGGGERLIELADAFAVGVGIDPDPVMIETASANARDLPNVTFAMGDAAMSGIDLTFDVILNRHAVLDLDAVADHLRPGGWFITQQVGEKNMRNVKAALGHKSQPATISAAQLEATSGLALQAFCEYDVEYVVHDIESLVFWLTALDLSHADFDGQSAVASTEILNRILRGNVDHRGFVTNEHRYLVVARRE